MSGVLLIWPESTGKTPERWLRLSDDGVIGRGGGWDAISPLAKGGYEDVVLVAPGADVALHWVDLPSASSAQAQAAARLLASEVSAAPIDILHVAVGESDEDGQRCLALIDADRLRGWMDHAQDLGLDPDVIAPEPLLLLAPEDGVNKLPCPEVDLVRGRGIAFAADPSLSALMLSQPSTIIDEGKFEAELSEALNRLPVDLRQGAFGKRRKWGVEWSLVRKLAKLAIAIVAITLLVQLVLMAKYSFAADRLERQQDEIARAALPRGQNVANAPAQLSERLTALRGGGRGFSTTAASLFAALQPNPNIELKAMQFDRQGRLRATLSGSSAGEISAIPRQLETSGFIVELGPVRSEGGRQVADIVMGSR